LELIKAYLIKNPPIVKYTFNNRNINRLHNIGYYYDPRCNDKYVLLNKHYYINKSYYRVVLRFEVNSTSKTNISYNTYVSVARNKYTLNLPVPFVIIHTHKNEDGSFVDSKVYHGPTLKNVFGYLEQGVPYDLIEAIYHDIQKCLFDEDSEQEVVYV